MREKQDIQPKNDKGQNNGHHELYYHDGGWYRCTYKNGFEIGYQEYHSTRVKVTEFFIR